MNQSNISQLVNTTPKTKLVIALRPWLGCMSVYIDHCLLATVKRHSTPCARRARVRTPPRPRPRQRRPPLSHTVDGNSAPQTHVQYTVRVQTTHRHSR
eukprot:4671839-Prymnesium_polylepis.1